MAGKQGGWGDSSQPGKAGWSAEAVDETAEEGWVSLTGEEGEIKDGTG